MRRQQLFNVLTAVILLFVSSVSFGQGVDLGAASSFALFTATGAFSNIGDATNVTGDVGTNVGAFTAFPPGILVGQIHTADGISAQAATDVDEAYSYLSSITCGVVIGTTLGNGQVLTPNIYCLGAASTLNGDLILDGQDDPNALFVIKIDGALSTTSFSNVILVNRASLCNVYWQINGSVTLGDSSVFRGIIVVDGAITLLEHATLYGQGLSRAGEIALHTNLVAIGMQPIANITAVGGNTTIGIGGSVVLRATATHGNGAFSFVWSGGQTDSTITVSPAVTTTYTVSVTSVNGCSSGIDTITVTVGPFVCDLTLGLTCKKPKCFGGADGSIDITASGAHGTVTYLWNDGATSEDRSGLTAGTYTVTATDAGGCTASITDVMSQPIALNITESHSDVSTLGGSDGSIDITVTGGSGRRMYLWNDGVTKEDRSGLAAGTYTVTITDRHLCTASATVIISELQGKSIATTSEAGAIKIYPNPVQNDFTIEVMANENSAQQYTVFVENQLGQIVYFTQSEKVSGNLTKQISFDHPIADGLYVIHVRGGGKELMKQLVIQH